MQSISDEAKPQALKSLMYKTPQELIHIRHGISLLQYKYWLLMLRAYREDHEKSGPISDSEICFISRTKLESDLGYQPKSSQIQSDLEALRKEPISFNVLEKDGQPGRRGTGFISEWFVSSARVGVLFPPIIKRAVEGLDDPSAIFHLLNWQIFNSFAGKHEAVIYKLAKDYVGTGGTPYMTIDKFRDYVGLGEKEYPVFKALNQWVIAGPVAKINRSELTDIQIATEFKRIQRKVVGLRFLVTKKHQQLLDFGDNPCFDDAKTPILKALQMQYLDGRTPELIEACIRRANIYAADQAKLGKAVNYSALYRRAIEENWGDEHLKKDELNSTEGASAGKKFEQIASETAAKKYANRRDEFLNYQKTKAVNEIDIKVRIAWAVEFLGDDVAATQVNPATGWFDDSLGNMKFKVFLRNKVQVEFNEAQFKLWTKAAG